MKQKQGTHSEYFRTVSCGNRKSCPTCKEKLEPGEKIWSWGEYVRSKWRTVTHFCKNCFIYKVKAPLINHGNDCDCTIELNGRGEKLPDWLNLDTSLWASKGLWGIRYHPKDGGTEAYRFVQGIGWVVDVHNDMPPEIWGELLTSVGAADGLLGQT